MCTINEFTVGIALNMGLTTNTLLGKDLHLSVYMYIYTHYFRVHED